MRVGKRFVFAVAGLGLFLAAAPMAGAADFYVDRDVPVSNPACLITDPCKTIAEGLDLADNAADPDTVHVAQSAGAYAEALTVPDTPMTLSGDDFDHTGGGNQAVIDGGTATTITLAFGNTTRRITGFTLSGGASGGLSDETLQGSGNNLTIDHNTFNETSPLDTYISVDGSPTISENVIVGFDDPTEWANGIGMNSATAPRIENNSISGVERPITVFGLTQQVTITGNTLEPTGDDAPSTPGEFGIGLGNGAGGEISGNLIRASVFSPPDASAAGISLTSDGPGTRRLARNKIFGFPGTGVWVETADPVTLDGDVIAANGDAGVRNLNTTTSITATNVTLWDNDVSGQIGEILVASGTSLSLDSSIVGDGGIGQGPGTPTCSATFSRGPAFSALCGDQFSTAATPSFANPAANDFHLTAGGNGALIDTGNPAAPVFPIDLDGEARALDGLADGLCTARRDIGADEVPGLSGADCVPTAPPAQVQAAPRCPKGKKLVTVKKRGKKKKKCKKKRRKRKK